MMRKEQRYRQKKTTNQSKNELLEHDTSSTLPPRAHKLISYRNTLSLPSQNSPDNETMILGLLAHLLLYWCPPQMWRRRP